MSDILSGSRTDDISPGTQRNIPWASKGARNPPCTLCDLGKCLDHVGQFSELRQLYFYDLGPSINSGTPHRAPRQRALGVEEADSGPHRPICFLNSFFGKDVGLRVRQQRRL
jgi:hypothetical protein